MTLGDVKAEIAIKTIEFEKAMELGKPHSELLKIYKELKNLQYEMIRLEFFAEERDLKIA